MQYFTRSPDIQLKELPILREPTRIIKISYPHNCIKKINATITKAVNVEEVDLSYNKLIFVDQIFQLRKLKHLNLSNNQISFIPKTVCKLKFILKIDLSFNLLQDIQSIQNLFQLNRLRKGKVCILLDGNPVSQIHKDEIVNRLKTIEEQSRAYIVSDFQPGLNEETFKSSQLYSRLKSQNEEGDKSLSHLGNHLSQVKFNGSFCQAKAQLENELQYLNTLERKFDVISGIETKNWTDNLERNFKKIAGSVKSLVENYKSIISILKSDISHPSETSVSLQTLFIQTSEIQQLIKDEHKKMLECLGESHQIPMNSYRVWVQLYRDLRALIEKIKQMGYVIIQGSIRNNEIEELKTISPEKTIEANKNKEDELNGLLFSKNKSGSTQRKQDCSECFIKEQEIKQLRQLSNLLSLENIELKQQLQSMSMQNSKLAKQQEILGKNLIQKQQNIINLLQMKPEASVYQKLILQQAKGIEDLIRCDRHLVAKEKKNLENTQKFTDFYKSAVAMQDAKFNFGKQIVSEFHLNEQEKLGNMPKWAYFNKNVDISMQKRRSKKNTEQSGTSTQKKRLRQNCCQERDLGKEKSLSNLLSMKTTERQTSEFSEFKVSREQGTSLDQKKPTSNKNVVISDFAITEGDNKNQRCKNKDSSQSSRQVLAELMVRKSKVYGGQHNIEKSKLNKITQYIVIKQENSRREGKEKIQVADKQNKPQYVPIQYHSVNVKNEEPFQKYMKYHLKNSIIETLQKKGRRHSLNKESSKQKVIKIKSREKEGNNQNGECSANKQSSRLLSQRFTSNRGRQQKNSVKNNYSLLNTNTKSYVDVLTKLRS